jgi:hypothetical protein
MRRTLVILTALILAAVPGAATAQEADAAIPLLTGTFNVPDEWYEQPNGDGAYGPWWIDEWDVEGDVEVSPCAGLEICGDHGQGNVVIGGPVVVVLSQSYSFGPVLVQTSVEWFCSVAAGEWDYWYCLNEPYAFGWSW